MVKYDLLINSLTVELRLQLEKVLQQGDIGDCAEPYMREDKVHTPHASHSRHLIYVHVYTCT